jgi:hypothetical protein
MGSCKGKKKRKLWVALVAGPVTRRGGARASVVGVSGIGTGESSAASGRELCRNRRVRAETMHGSRTRTCSAKRITKGAIGIWRT